MSLFPNKAFQWLGFVSLLAGTRYFVYAHIEIEDERWFLLMLGANFLATMAVAFLVGATRIVFFLPALRVLATKVVFTICAISIGAVMGVAAGLASSTYTYSKQIHSGIRSGKDVELISRHPLVAAMKIRNESWLVSLPENSYFIYDESGRYAGLARAGALRTLADSDAARNACWDVYQSMPLARSGRYVFASGPGNTCREPR